MFVTTTPIEFDPDVIATNSSPEQQMYRAENSSAEPMKSVLENNPEIYFVPPKRGGDWGNWEFKTGAYYDTTIGAKHPYWQDKDLPQPSKDIEQLRRDMLRWGYCKIEDALSAEQVAVVRKRVLEQAEGEKLAGIAQKLKDLPAGSRVLGFNYDTGERYLSVPDFLPE